MRLLMRIIVMTNRPFCLGDQLYWAVPLRFSGTDAAHGSSKGRGQALNWGLVDPVYVLFAVVQPLQTADVGFTLSA